MKKEILLYNAIYSYSAAQFITDLEAAKGGDITIRINTPGGDVYACYGMIAKIKEHTGKKNIIVDGQASSMGAFLCCFVDSAEGLDVSTFIFHRAAAPSWLEMDPSLFTDDVKASLKKVNDELRAAMEGKFTADKWKEVTGTSLDDLFSLNSRIDVELNAKQALDLGLISKINTITPEKKAEIQKLAYRMAAEHIITQEISNNNQNKNTMTIEKLQAEHPDVYKAIYNAGVNAERDRVGSYMAFAHVDLDSVKKGISGGEILTATAMAELSLKAMTAQKVAGMEQDRARDIDNQEPEGKGKDAVNSAFEATVRSNLGLK